MASLHLIIAAVLFVCSSQLLLKPTQRPIWQKAETEINLVCEANKGQTITWLKDGKNFTTDKRTTIKEDHESKLVSTLTINPTKFSDKGLYACEADAQTANVEINFLKISIVDFLYEGKNKNASICATPEGLSEEHRKKMRVSWLKNGTDVPIVYGNDYQLNRANNCLTIIKADRKDIGAYFCTFAFDVKENSSSKLSTTTLVETVSLNAKPYVKSSYTSKNLVEGDILKLECEASGYPPPQIYWFKGDQLLSSGNRTTIEDLIKDDADGKIFVKDGSLRIEDLTFDDYGNYTCEAENKYGTFNATVLVRVKDKLAALWPFLAIVCEVFILCVIIFIYEKKKSKELDAAAAHLNGKSEPYGDIPQEKKSSKEDVRLRKP